MAGITDPAARARSYVARETGLRERETLEARVTALERLVGSQYEGAGDVGRPASWTMVEIVTALPQATKDMVGRIVALRKENGFATLNVCILDGYGVARWVLAMGLRTLVASGGDKTAVDTAQSIEITGGDVVTYVSS